MGKVKIGDPAPGFEGVDQHGNFLKLEDFKGHKLILYFYPKDNTPGCTAEACSLRDNYQQLLDKGFKIIGISPDSAQSHKNFSSKYVLPFPLLPDIEKNIIQDYGAWGLKKLYGKAYEGLLRTTFIIDEHGFIEDIITRVDTKNHAQQIVTRFK